LVRLNDQYDDERVIATSSGNSNNNISGAEYDEQRSRIRTYTTLKIVWGGGEKASSATDLNNFLHYHK